MKPCHRERNHMETKQARFQWIEIDKIQPNRLNPRIEFSKEGLDTLSDSLQAVGMIEPIVVRPRREGFEVVVGERRYRAAQQAGLHEVPALIQDFTNSEVLELNLIENLHREDLSAIEKGKTCLRLLKEVPKTYPSRRALSERLGYGESTINGWIALATEIPEEAHTLIAPETTQRTIPEGKVDWRTAERVARQIEEPQKRVEVLRELVDQRIRGVRARDVVRRLAREPKRPVQEVIKEIKEEPAELPFRLKHMDSIREGIKTQTSRKGLPDPKVRPGATVYASIHEPRAALLKVLSVERKRLGDFTGEDAQREGGYTLEEFKRVWAEIHPEGWDDGMSVFVIRFEQTENEEGEEAET